MAVLAFVGCGGGSSEEAKKLLTQILTLVGIPQDIVVSICEDSNDNGLCDVGEFKAKIAIHRGDTLQKILNKVKFDKDGKYLLENYDPTKNIIMEIEDKKNLKYDNGKLTFKYTLIHKSYRFFKLLLMQIFYWKSRQKSLRS